MSPASKVNLQTGLGFFWLGWATQLAWEPRLVFGQTTCSRLAAV